MTIGKNPYLLFLFEFIKIESNEIYLDKKFIDHRTYTVTILLLLIPLGFVEVFFDYKNEVLFESGLFYMRLYQILLILPAIAILKSKSAKKSTFIICLTVFLLCFYTIKISEILGGESLHNISTLTIYPFLIFFIMLGFSVYMQVSFLVFSFLFFTYFKLNFSENNVVQNIYFQVYFLYSVAALLSMLIFSWGYYRRYCFELALEESSKTDSLTGVANRRHFDSSLKAEISRSVRSGSNCALILLDIDSFKNINDLHGHPVGDRTICSLADICVSLSRKVDLVARIGGEEFAIILPNTKIDEAKNLAERIRINVESIEVKDELEDPIKFTISLGVSVFSGNLHTEKTEKYLVKKLIQQADIALYDAKKNGRNRTVLYLSDN
ncbi:GGDEF domain-containing protein [Vibrio metschnikovii]|nr:GGDEF domain-containing protein [Vibrio metschnikovii]EKO3688376.1 GGDEF domain-containing protein [Vibrio metschnikovii]EKO3691757.1 GGDEF domain-containing protein [Vibrio metschnikovii]EKO3781764.1 GGDEF domain-containing protein [Vibrio metschnikovii]EKO3888658.1 GGDEF domain-containing protein [Vibrio metschnikovii]